MTKYDEAKRFKSISETSAGDDVSIKITVKLQTGSLQLIFLPNAWTNANTDWRVRHAFNAAVVEAVILHGKTRLV